MKNLRTNALRDQTIQLGGCSGRARLGREDHPSAAPRPGIRTPNTLLAPHVPVEILVEIIAAGRTSSAIRTPRICFAGTCRLKWFRNCWATRRWRPRLILSPTSTSDTWGRPWHRRAGCLTSCTDGDILSPERGRLMARREVRGGSTGPGDVLPRLRPALSPRFDAAVIVLDGAELSGNPFPLCSIEGCVRFLSTKQLCQTHLYRWNKLGQPGLDEFRAQSARQAETRGGTGSLLTDSGRESTNFRMPHPPYGGPMRAVLRSGTFLEPPIASSAFERDVWRPEVMGFRGRTEASRAGCGQHRAAAIVPVNFPRSLSSIVDN